MKAIELVKAINGEFYGEQKPFDGWIAGDQEKEIRRVAVCMFPTVNVLREVAAWGADMMIPHEPTFNHGHDQFVPNQVTLAKKKIVDESGLVIYRLHDFMHAAYPDMICRGFTDALGLSGHYESKKSFVLDEPISALELAERMEARMGMAHVRICGSRDHKTTRLTLDCGAPGRGLLDIIREGDFELIVVGEFCEWYEGEYIRDWGELTNEKAAVTVGHALSERDGMKYLTKELADRYPELEFRYFECGEVYTYTK